MAYLLHLVLLVLSLALPFRFTSADLTSYRAAVLEHEAQPYASSPLETMLANVKIYSDTCVKAKQQKVDLLVFPEYGIAGFNRPRSVEDGFYIHFPDSAIGSLPCDSVQNIRDDSENHRILEILSCAARNNSVALVANVMTKVPCNRTQDPTCPDNEFFKYNTNLAFNKDGTLLARHHKRRLFGNTDANPGKKEDIQIVDAGFVKFAMLTSFDAMYNDMLLDYVNKHGVKNIVLVNAWYDELPYLSAIQMASRMARGLAINVIAANLFSPTDSMLGSGIYSSSLGAVNEVNDLSRPGHLLTADIQINPLPIPETNFECSFTQQNVTLPKETEDIFRIQSVQTNKPSSSPTPMLHEIWYDSLRNFSRIFLESKEGNASLCEGGLCCHLDYAFDGEPKQDLYALAIRDGPHPFGPLRFHRQVCSVLRCQSKDIETCGKIVQAPSLVKFSRLVLTGSFTTTSLFPSVLATDLQSFPDDEWRFEKGKCAVDQPKFQYGGRLQLISPASKAIMSASIYGRVDDKD